MPRNSLHTTLVLLLLLLSFIALASSAAVCLNRNQTFGFCTNCSDIQILTSGYCYDKMRGCLIQSNGPYPLVTCTQCESGYVASGNICLRFAVYYNITTINPSPPPQVIDPTTPLNNSAVNSNSTSGTSQNAANSTGSNPPVGSNISSNTGNNSSSGTASGQTSGGATPITNNNTTIITNITVNQSSVILNFLVKTYPELSSYQSYSVSSPASNTYTFNFSTPPFADQYTITVVVSLTSNATIKSVISYLKNGIDFTNSSSPSVVLSKSSDLSTDSSYVLVMQYYLNQTGNKDFPSTVRV